MTRRKKPQPQELLGTKSASYDPMPSAYGNFQYLGIGRPPFTAAVISAMLTDPRVIYGLWLIKGPILSNAHVKVDCPNETVRQYVIDQINRFWTNSAVRALKAIEWGYASGEVIYREKDGLVQFDELRDFHSPDVRIVVKDGNAVGVELRNTRTKHSRLFFGFPKTFLHTHWREKARYYGLSRLYGVHIPWWEIWSDGGYRDIRRLWYYKNSFEGGTMRHPPGQSRTEQEGVLKSNRDIARELIEKKRTGGVLTLPNTPAGDSGNYAWEYEPPQANVAPEGLLEYGETLRDEILEALGIPPEIVSSGGDQGFGSSTGRQVPQMAFYAILQELLQWLVTDLDDYILRPLVRIVFGEGADNYELLPFKLSEDLNEPNDLSADNFNGNQFQDENQRSVIMSYTPDGSQLQHFRHRRRWWTKLPSGVIRPMSTAI